MHAIAMQREVTLKIIHSVETVRHTLYVGVKFLNERRPIIQYVNVCESKNYQYCFAFGSVYSTGIHAISQIPIREPVV